MLLAWFDPSPSSSLAAVFVRFIITLSCTCTKCLYVILWLHASNVIIEQLVAGREVTKNIKSLYISSNCF
jgi:hypothetical protein